MNCHRFCSLMLAMLLAPTAFAADSRSKAPRKGFLRQKEAEEEMLMALQEAVAHIHDQGVTSLEDLAIGLKASYSSLQKTAPGKISNTAVRYLVHKYFMKAHGWQIRGLELASTTGAIVDPAGSTPNDRLIFLKDKVPFFVETALKDYGASGFELSDAIMLVSLLEHLILDEGIYTLEAAYTINDLNSDMLLSDSDMTQMFKSYVVFFTNGNWKENLSAAQHQTDIDRAQDGTSSLIERATLVQDMQQSVSFAKRNIANPFREALFSLSDSIKIMRGVNQQFAVNHEAECQNLKLGLADMDVSGTGRVSLKRFWAQERIGHWQLQESADFLRQLGALDEVSGRVPQVIIPNYVNAVSNCDSPSDYYSVCCIQECEHLLNKLEDNIQSPSAGTSRILDLVANLPSATVNAPRNISTSLIKALQEVADVHGGQVPLHGRLFAQWLHFAYPRECPYPHMSSALKPLTPKDRVLASADEKGRYQDDEDSVMEGTMSMWSLEEEWHADAAADSNFVPSKPRSSTGSALVGIAQVAAGALVLLSLWRSFAGSASKWIGSSQKPSFGKKNYGEYSV